MKLSYAEIIDPKSEGMKLPQRYSRYVIKRDGEIFGKIEWSYRPKNAGGSAWMASYPSPHGGTYVVYNKTFGGLLKEVRRRLSE